MPAAILDKVEATWDQERSAEDLRNFLAPRLASHALVDVDIAADDFDVDRLFDNVE
jgi:hypothetical protein